VVFQNTVAELGLETLQHSPDRSHCLVEQNCTVRKLINEVSVRCWLCAHLDIFVGELVDTGTKLTLGSQHLHGPWHSRLQRANLLHQKCKTKKEFVAVFVY